MHHKQREKGVWECTLQYITNTYYPLAKNSEKSRHNFKLIQYGEMGIHTYVSGNINQ